MRDYSGIERGELIEEIYRKEAEIERLEEVLRGVGAGDPDVCHHVRTSRVDGTRASMHFETSLADGSAARSARVGTMIWASRAALGAGGRNGTNG